MAFPHLRLPKRATRIVGVLCAVALTTAGPGLMASPASAGMTCTGRPDSNVCLIDVHVGQQEADAFLSQGNPSTVSLIGDDPSYENYMFTSPPINPGSAD